VRELVLHAPVPAEIGAAVVGAYRALGPDLPVAVRSSATAEDLPFASFAGQQDTFLNVIGADAVLAAVRRCWASLWTDRAVAYRMSNGIDHGAVSIAVVVQVMVDAAVAGVLFTANPVTGRRHEVVIDASPGLGEAVVSGAVNPDHFVVDGDTRRISQRVIGDKRLIIRGSPGGGTVRIDREADGDAACLDDRQVRQLAVLGRQVETLYGAPQDAEWAIDVNGKLWLTQARPITTLYPLPSRAHAGAGTRVYLCASLAQGLTRPITPMGLAGFRMLATNIARAARFEVPEPLNGPRAYAEAGQRFFVDLTPALRSRTGRDIVPKVFDVMEARSAAVLRSLFDDPRFSVVTTSRWPFLRRIGPVAARAGLPLQLLRAAIRPAAALRRVNLAIARLTAALKVPDSATPVQRLAHAERILGRELFPILPAILPLPALGFAMLGLARRLLGDLAEPGELQTVLRGLPHNVTTEMDLALWHLATRIRGDADAARAFTDESVEELTRRYLSGALPGGAQSGLEGFLRRYGHRAVAEIDLGMPRWRDDPTHIVGVLANYLLLTDPDAAPDKQFESAARQADEQVARLVAKASGRGRLRGHLVRLALKRTRQLAGSRELPKYYLVVALAAVREQLALVGTELAAVGTIAAGDDVFFLDLVEARQGLGGTDLRGLVEKRREDYRQELRRRHIPRILISDGTEPETLLAAGAARSDGALVGSPASAGVVTGTARVILDPVGARLEPGEILVAPSTDPGWTPLFLTAGGLVMEMGGANSHGAVVAREYGIPAVVGVPLATTRLVTGQRITVDGAAGTVTPAP
jgi:pyruvate,water dikinase